MEYLFNFIFIAQVQTRYRRLKYTAEVFAMFACMPNFFKPWRMQMLGLTGR